MKTDISIRAAVYLRAAELVEQNGICKISYSQNNSKQRCARGHLMAASKELFGDAILFHKFENAEDFNIMVFNDRPDTTAAMIAAKLRERAFI